MMADEVMGVSEIIGGGPAQSLPHWYAESKSGLASERNPNGTDYVAGLIAMVDEDDEDKHYTLGISECPRCGAKMEKMLRHCLKRHKFAQCEGCRRKSVKAARKRHKEKAQQWSSCSEETKCK